MGGAIKLLILLLMCTYVHAAGTPQPPGLGVIAGNTLGVSVGDFNLFNPDEYILDIKRYGGGTSRLEIGNALGLSLSSHSGWIVYEKSIFFIALEGASGQLVANTNSNTRSFYEWTPMVSVGPKLHIGSSTVVLAARYGLGIGNFTNYGLTPNSNQALGFSLYITGNYLNLGYEYTAIGSTYFINSLDLIADKFLIRLEDTQGLVPNKSILLLYRFNLY